jgi:hypothetical protein
MRAILSTDDCHQVQYALYIRRYDHTMRLVERDTGKPVSIEAVLPIKAGLIVRPQDAVRVLLMADEIVVVDEFPKVMSRA